MVRKLTEEELCELAEIRERLKYLVFEANEEEEIVQPTDLLYIQLLETFEMKDMLQELLELLRNENETE